MDAKLYQIKQHLVDFTHRKVTEGKLESINSKELGELIDMVKDLAQAEESCAEARYYNSVADAMGAEKSGYSMGYNPQGNNQYTMGYTPSNSNGSNTNQYSMGYNSDLVSSIKSTMRSANPMLREQLKRDVEKALQEI